MRQRRAFLCIGVVSLLGFVACNTGERESRNKTEPVESLGALGVELKLRFPPSARLVGVDRSPGGMDDAVRVKLEVAAAELPSLLAQTQIDAESFEPGTGGLFGPDQDFWDPHQSVALRSGQARREGGRVLNVGIDDRRAGSAVVYIVEHGT
jgi:hypothetical protein